MEVADDQNSEQRKAACRDHPPLRLAPSVLEWISWFQECVSQEVPQSHVVTIPEQVLEFLVDFLHREHSLLIQWRAGHEPPPARPRAAEPGARPPHLSRRPQTLIAARLQCP